MVGHTNAQFMAAAVLGMAELITLGECAEARVERCQEMAVENNPEQFMSHTNTLRKLGWQHRSLTW